MSGQRPWIIEDYAITSRDQDRFDHQSVARELITIVRGSTQPLAIGLLGPFGSGKSSVVRLMAADMQGDKRWAVLQLSAERHSGPARARGLLYALLHEAYRQNLITQQTRDAERACLDGGRQRTESRPTSTSAKPGQAKWTTYPRAAGSALLWMLGLLLLLWAVGAVGVGLGHLVGWGAGVSIVTWFASPEARPLTTALTGAAVVACILAAGKEGALATLKKYEITLATPRPESTDDLEQVFSNLIENIDRRLVIAIDDIDRLGATEVLEALATVRSLLLTGTHHKYPPVFLLSATRTLCEKPLLVYAQGLPIGPHIACQAIKRARIRSRKKRLRKKPRRNI